MVIQVTTPPETPIQLINKNPHKLDVSAKNNKIKPAAQSKPHSILAVKNLKPAIPTEQQIHLQTKSISQLDD